MGKGKSWGIGRLNMDFLVYYVLPFVIVLGILIFFHELGHFLAAKSFGVKVEKFSLGFGPKLFGKKFGETEYMISVVPLGGYVKLLGEEETEDTNLPPEEEERAFSNQHVLKRIVIVAAGPIFNILLALFLFIFFYMAVGAEVRVPEVGQVTPNSPAAHAGLKKGDVFVSINGKKINTWEELKDIVEHSKGSPLTCKIKRDHRLITTVITPQQSVIKNLFGEKVKSVIIGVVQSGKIKIVSLGPISAITMGVKRTWEITKLTCLTVVKLVQRAIPIKALGGPILIGQMTGQLAKENIIYLVPFMGFISINLGILNLLPIPVLDGGFIVFFLIELVTGKSLTVKLKERAQQVGIAILIMLMLVVFYNDIARLLK